jgi:hypothetical protein
MNVIYISAFMLDVGMSLVGSFNDGNEDNFTPPEWWMLNQEGTAMMPDAPEERFYNDVVDKRIVEERVKSLKPQSKGSYWSKTTYAPWKDVETGYVVCPRDNAIPVEVQRKWVCEVDGWYGREGTGRTVRVAELESSHSPMLSMPETLARVILGMLERGVG